VGSDAAAADTRFRRGLKADAMAVLPLVGLGEVVVREVVSAGAASVLA
jgi:hypothetical protein